MSLFLKRGRTRCALPPLATLQPRSKWCCNALIANSHIYCLAAGRPEPSSAIAPRGRHTREAPDIPGRTSCFRLAEDVATAQAEASPLTHPLVHLVSPAHERRGNSPGMRLTVRSPVTRRGVVCVAPHEAMRETVGSRPDHIFGLRCQRPNARSDDLGEVAERLKAPHSKCGILARVSRVRIPPSPPDVAKNARICLSRASTFLPILAAREARSPGN